MCFDGVNVWSAAGQGGNGKLIKLDVTTGEVASYSLPASLNFSAGIIFAFGFLWVVNPGLGNELYKIDPSDGSIVATINPITDPDLTTAQGGNLCSDDTSIWVCYEYVNLGPADVGAAIKIDPTSGAILNTVIVGESCQDICFDGTDRWTANGFDGIVSRIDGSDTIIASILVGDGIEFDSDIQNILFDGTDIWVLDSFIGQLVQIDRGTNTITNRYTLGDFPFGFIYESGLIFILMQTGPEMRAYKTSEGSLDSTTPITGYDVNYGSNGGPSPFAFDGSALWLGFARKSADDSGQGTKIPLSGCHCSTVPDLPDIEAWYVVNEPTIGFTDRTSKMFYGSGAKHSLNLQVRQRGNWDYTLRMDPDEDYTPTRGTPVYSFDQNAAGFHLAFAGIIQDYVTRLVGNDGMRYIDVTAVTFDYIFDTTYVEYPVEYKDQTTGFIVRDLLCRFCCGSQVVAGTIEDGPVIGLFNANLGDAIRSLFDQCASTAQKIWYVAIDTQTLEYVAPDAVAAPFTITSENPLWDTISVKLNGSDYRNRQAVRISFDAFAHSCEFFEGAGQTVIQLARPVEQVTNAWATLSTCNTATGMFTGQPSDGDTVTVSIPAGSGFGWQASHAYALDGVIVVDGFVQKVTTAGTTGSSEPTFSEVTGDTTIDNTVIWTCQGSAGLATGDQTYTFRDTIDNTQFGEVLIGATDTDTAQNLVYAINATERVDFTQIRGINFSLPTWENSLCNAVELSGLSFTIQQKHAGSGWLAALAWTGANFSFDADVTNGGTSPQGSLGPGEGATISLQVYVRGTSVAAPGLDYVPGSAEVHLATPLNVGSNLNVEYTRAGGNIIQVEDTPKVTALAAVTHGTGRVELLTDQSQTGLINTDAATGLQFAQELLATYDDPSEEFSLELFQPGLLPGQQITMDLAAPLDAFNGPYFIEEVNAELVTVYPYLDGPGCVDAGHYHYTAKLLSVAQFQNQYLDFWARNQGGGSAGGGGSSPTSGGGLAPPGTGIVLETDGVKNGSQTELNLVAGTNITLTDDGVGGVTIDATAGGTGTVTHTGALTADLPVFGNGTADIKVGTKSGNTNELATSTGVKTGGHLATWDSGGNLQDGGVPGTGTVTHTGGALTAHLLAVGNGGSDIETPVSIGTAGQYLRSGGAATDPAFASILGTEVAAATSSVRGTVQPDGTIITVSAGAITVPKASSSVFGVVEVDNVTITATAGVISSVGSAPLNQSIKVNGVEFSDDYEIFVDRPTPVTVSTSTPSTLRAFLTDGAPCRTPGLLTDGQKVTTYVAIATAGLGVSPIYAVNDVTGKNAAFTLITFTPAANGTFRVGGYVTITAVATDVLQLQVAYTDETNTARTIALFPIGVTSASLSTTGVYLFPDVMIRAKAAVAITLAVALTIGAGSVTYDAGGMISQIS